MKVKYQLYQRKKSILIGVKMAVILTAPYDLRGKTTTKIKPPLWPTDEWKIVWINKIKHGRPHTAMRMALKR